MFLTLRMSYDDPDRITIYPMYETNEMTNYEKDDDSYLTITIYEAFLLEFIKEELKEFLGVVDRLFKAFVRVC